MRRKLLLLHRSSPTNPEQQNRDEDDVEDDDGKDDEEEREEGEEGDKGDLATPQPSALPAKIAAVASVCLSKINIMFRLTITI